MLSEEKIKLMTSIAMFEKKEGKKIFPVVRFFKSDYISSRLLRSFLSYTLSYLLLILAWCVYRVDELLNMMDADRMIVMGKRFAVYYGAGLLVYLVITVVICLKRYRYAARGLKMYQAKLRRLEKRYEFQNKSRELTKGGRTS